MITDQESNFVYVSNHLEAKSPAVYGQLRHWFDKLKIRFGILPHTNDLWVVDFMPLQIKQDQFIQFTYDPDYLKPRTERPTKTDPAPICKVIDVVPHEVNIIIDGGNVVKSKSKVIMTTKVFKENPAHSETELLECIRAKLQVEQVIIIPQEPKDFVGHADGMVRFIDYETVLVNHYPNNKVYQDFAYSLRWSLRNAGLKVVELPYTSWQNGDENDASGCYINFLEVGNFIFCPAFAQHADQPALSKLQEVFIGRTIKSIDCSELAKRGGVLNCATWNILKN